MSKRQSEISRFLNWYHSLESEEARQIVAGQVRDTLRQDKPKVTRRASKPKGMIILPDSQINKEKK